jgi:DNA polymerase I-like protein with 3'-5' exonuclease and polymerase domains
MPDDGDFGFDDALAQFLPSGQAAAPIPLNRSAPATSASVQGDSMADYLAAAAPLGSPEQSLIRPWMAFHVFNLVTSVDEVRKIVDKALAHGRCALDLETEGFDNRIYFTEEERPYTVHQIVGYCLAIRGVGYYIPVRHKFNPTYGEKDPNVPVAGVEAEIRRLCLASQPVLTEEGRLEDPLGSAKIETPGKVLMYFWNAKFDQEFLYPVTGIDYWHPASFEDGMLAAYTLYSDDSLGLKDKAFERLSITDPTLKVDGKPVVHRYEMIKFEELFVLGEKARDRKFADLYPEEGTPVVMYGCSDAICTELLCEVKGEWELTHPDLRHEYKEVVSAVTNSRFTYTYKLEKQASQATRVMERPRVKIDKQEIVSLLERATQEREEYDLQIKKLAESKGFKDFNPGSTKQLSEFLFGSNGLDITPKPEMNEASQQYKTDAATLEKMAESADAPPVLEWIVKYRQIDKIIGTYLTSMSQNCNKFDELRFGFNQTGAATGRFTASAGDPVHGFSGIPIHGIPARSDPKKPKVAHSLRRAFVAREGYTYVKIDYAGQELRVVANLSNEKVWLDEFLHGSGDLHTITAQAFFGAHITKDHKVERNAGKIANFSLIYGGGTQAIMRATKCDKVEAARRKANFDKSVPTFASWVKGQHVLVKRNKGVTTAFKRFIAIPDANVKEGDLDFKGNPLTEQDARKIQASCERKSTNFPIQGSGADIMKISMIKLVKELYRRGWLRNGGDDSVRLLMTVHDEIVFEVKHERLAEAVPLLIAIMESPSKMVNWKVPLIVEPLISLNWEAKIEWHKVMSGEVPVPDWLVGILDPSNPVSPSAAPKSKPKPTFDASPTASDKVPERPPAKGTLPVAVFALSEHYLTSRSVELVFEAVAASLDPDSRVFLCLKDNGGNLLIDPTLRKIPIQPEVFKIRIRDKNLGPGDFIYKEEPLN